MIKAFLFDWGGVMSAPEQIGDLDKKLAKELNITKSKATEFLTIVWNDIKKGNINDEELWSILEKYHGKPINESNRNVWSKWNELKPLPEMVDLVNRLRKEKYQLGLLSTTIPSSANEIKSHGGYDLFDFTVLSYETGIAKPDADIYKLAISKFDNVAPREIVFIDDRPLNLTPAKELGIHTILAKDSRQVIKEVEKYLKKSDN
jgi:epoxide hydrolase-like predicted phosphatase